jgi:translation initiation factor 3 subunit K
MPDFSLSVALLSEQRHYAAVNANNSDEPDPLPGLLPQLSSLSSLLEQCRFREFWRLYKSDELDTLRDNYTVECKGFNANIREAVVRAVKAAFQSITIERLSNYLDIFGSF